jgi:hypothetical protein
VDKENIDPLSLFLSSLYHFLSYLISALLMKEFEVGSQMVLSLLFWFRMLRGLMSLREFAHLGIAFL